MTRWIVPALCALGIHAVLFNLDVELTRPAFSITENRPVTLSLVEIPTPPSSTIAPLPAAPDSPIQPLDPLEPPPTSRPAPTARPAPPPAAPEPRRAEQAPTEPSRPDPIPRDAGSSSDPAPDPSPRQSHQAMVDPTPPPGEDAAPDQPKVRASRPLYAQNPPPDYPAVARRRNYQGTVVLDVLVDPAGRVTDVKVNESSGYSVLDQSAVRSVRRWRFEPARRAGRPIEMWVQVPVRFALE